MARQIIKQPDGRYAVWSTIVDDFVAVNVDRDEIIEMFVEGERQRIIQSVDETLEHIAAGRPAYYQFTKSFDDCVALIRANHGDDAESLRLIERTKL